MDETIAVALDRIGQLMYDRSPRFADQFAEDAVLIGSERGEVARGRDAIAALIARFHALPARYTWAWMTTECFVEGSCAWLFAEGVVVKEAADGARTSRPYRLSGVLSRHGPGWEWRLFHGSEPMVV